MNVYLADLQAWPIEVVLKALDLWPERSEWWPKWKELLGVIGEIQADRITKLPPPRWRSPNERRNAEMAEMHAPFSTKRDWLEFQDSMRQLRDPSIPMIAREHLLKIGEAIEARQRPNAEARKWA